MVEKYLGKEAADDIFMSALVTGLMNEKQAAVLSDALEKRAFNWAAVLEALKGVHGGVKTFFGDAASMMGGAATAAKDVVGAGAEGVKGLGLLAALGAGTGVIGSSAYDVLKDRVSSEDPEAKFKNDLESLYNGKRRELEDAQWMDRVRAMRDELKRGYKKMSTSEYSAKYKALQDALDERKS